MIIKYVLQYIHPRSVWKLWKKLCVVWEMFECAQNMFKNSIAISVYREYEMKKKLKFYFLKHANCEYDQTECEHVCASKRDSMINRTNWINGQADSQPGRRRERWKDLETDEHYKNKWN